MRNLVGPRHLHDFQMPVRQIVPKEDGEASCDVSVQKSPNFILPRKIRVRTRRFLDRCEPLKQKITIALLQLPDELENRRVDQQAALHSSAGSGIRSRRALNSSGVSQRLWSGSSSTAEASRNFSAHCCSRSETRKANSSFRPFSSRAAASRFRASILIRRNKACFGQLEQFSCAPPSAPARLNPSQSSESCFARRFPSS